MLKLSIVIPVFNEEQLIKQTLNKLDEYLKSMQISYEIVVVDDGSSDKTVYIVKNINNKKIKFVKIKANKGKGAALKAGILESSGELIIFMDADLSVPLEYLEPLIVNLKKYDVVIGTRRTKKSKIVVHQPVIRETLGRVFTKLTQLLTNTKLSDYTCGFKGFKKEVAHKVFKNSLIERWAYDAEIMFLANKYNYSISEIPVEWYNRAETKVKLGSAILTSFKDLIKVRINDFLGKYER